MSEIYPQFNDDSDHPLYYVEFDRGFSKDTFTFFKRSFLYSKEQWIEIKNTCINDAERYMYDLMNREGHPYQLFNGTCKKGCVPDKEMIKFFVDAINEKVERENNKRK